MAIHLEQLQDRYEARNPAQWDWRVIDKECHAAGNSPILNLRFERHIKKARRCIKLRKLQVRQRLKQRRLFPNRRSGMFRGDLIGWAYQ